MMFSKGASGVGGAPRLIQGRCGSAQASRSSRAKARRLAWRCALPLGPCRPAPGRMRVKAVKGLRRGQVKGADMDVLR